jgi:hypothetical protein
MGNTKKYKNRDQNGREDLFAMGTDRKTIVTVIEMQ